MSMRSCNNPQSSPYGGIGEVFNESFAMIQELYKKLDVLTGVYAELTQLNQDNSSITAIVELGKITTEIQNIYANIDQILAVASNSAGNFSYYEPAGDGITDDSVAWQAACTAIDGSILVVPKGTYKLSNFGLVTKPGAIIFQRGALLKLANGVIVNTDSANGNFMPMVRLQGVDGFILDGVRCDGNRINQTYPATISTFGRGDTPSTHNASIEICSDGVNKSRNLYIRNCELFNSYRNGCQLIQTEGARIINNYTHDNTWNGFGGIENNDLVAFGNKSYRDGVSTQFPDTQNSGDRGAFQFREMRSTVTTSSAGIPIIPNTPRINGSLKFYANYIEECCVVGIFARSMLIGEATGNTVKNAGYSRASTAYRPAAIWFEWGLHTISNNFIQQTRNNEENGWLKPDGIIAYTFKGDGALQGSVNIDGNYGSIITNNTIFCGEDYDNVNNNYSSNDRKKNNLFKGMRSESNAYIKGNTFEGVTEEFIFLISDQNFSTENLRDIVISDNTFTNSIGTAVIKFQIFGSPTGTLKDIKIAHNCAKDLRSIASGSEDRVAILFDILYANTLIENLEVINNTFDCSNSIDNTKSYEFLRVRCNQNSTIIVNENKVNNPSVFVTFSKFKALTIKNNRITNPKQIFNIPLTASSGYLSIIDNEFLDITTSIGAFVDNGFLLKLLRMTGNIITGNFSGFLFGFVPGKCPKQLYYRDNFDYSTTPIDPNSLANDAGQLFTLVQRPHLNYGDFLLSAINIDSGGILMSPSVAASQGTAEVRFENQTGGTLDLSSCGLRLSRYTPRFGDLYTAIPYTPPSLAINEGIYVNVTLSGAKVGDFVLVSFSRHLKQCCLFGEVIDVDTVRVRFQNQTGATQQPDPGILRIIVLPKDGYNGITGTTTFDPPSLNDDQGATTTVTVTGAELGDVSLVSYGIALPRDLVIYSWVSAPNTVSVRIINFYGATVDVASSTITAAILQP